MVESVAGIISHRTCLIPGRRGKKFLRAIECRTGINLFPRSAGNEYNRFLIAINLAAKILIGGVEMLNRDITQASDTGSYIDTARYLNDVELA